MSIVNECFQDAKLRKLMISKVATMMQKEIKTMCFISVQLHPEVHRSSSDVQVQKQTGYYRDAVMLPNLVASTH